MINGTILDVESWSIYNLTCCRGCGSSELEDLLNLGKSPVANNFISADNDREVESKFPLKLKVCSHCAFVQLSEQLPREILFNESYLYFSSYSSSWLDHSKIFANKMKKYLDLTTSSLVLEIASNDGYLLKFFKELGIQTLGIEPSANVAAIAIREGISTEVDFFSFSKSKQLAEELEKVDLIVVNNVLAHVPDIHDFISGISQLVTLETVVSIEFPHLANLMKFNQFDTVYHEHFSYLSVTSLLPIFNLYGLKVFYVENLDTHGGSLRLFVDSVASPRVVDKSVDETLSLEICYDPRILSNRTLLQQNVAKVRNDLIDEITRIRREGKKIALYGAAAKGNTLLNFCEIKKSDIEYAVDLNPNKQNLLLPGTHIPVRDIIELNNNPVDVILILPWNLGPEINTQLKNYIENSFVTFRAIPKIEYYLNE